MPRVVLLRERSGTPDLYEDALQRAGFQAESIAVLEYRFVNGDPLRASLSDTRFGVLALTSPRAADALARIGLPEGWAGRTAWVVGEETARRAAALGLRPRGAESGSAEALVARLAQHPPEMPVLFVCGNRRRAALPNGLRAHGIAFEEVVAYETALRSPPLLSGQAPSVIVFFSPSGVEAAQADPDFPWTARRIAIGPTTASALAGAGHPAHAVAAVPTPAGVAVAVRGAELPSPGSGNA